MNYKNFKKCDVCGRSDSLTTIANSGLGPMSFSYCSMCLSMNAEPYIEGLTNSGLDTFYVKEEDKYYKYVQKAKGTDSVHVPIKLSDGSSFHTRKDALARYYYLNEMVIVFKEEGEYVAKFNHFENGIFGVGYTKREAIKELLDAVDAYCEYKNEG
ncbi:MAG: hypothetical protein ACOCP4_02755 [Candidatus Woesearchaeota archaeon]